ncbi:rod shape-determining protein RodA [Desulfuromonas acetoxidans]|uniref:Peptidoglycan glycosyltransferase RodA n=1 Tax=Desulfuromonas acetoxidans (strain DSM 684 / 11070) TaxID=281689 RepID=Q1JVG4_DESA6|nr:rod shape-determining protein RodA [Desulfuromonas acetoxidans]EAT14233.1 Rod shape-determining protein RodA [Desulfuromonas acetoxidans DSM 684]MBF0645869.1 rod shape-determining protein RodA [Desulfuromonas acetoxidans]NVD25049.1 rod shape-determining protein RodA [Desulfuromonas acetoxidans]NVE17094.1 rod shape-determining protein RodA [Desulfuromonas acetoxidans]
MFDRRLVSNIDWILLGLVLTAAGIGIMNLYSSTSTWNMTATPIYLKQIYWLGLGLLIAFAVALFDYRHLEYLGIYGYIGCVSLLAGVLLFGKTSMGATRWIDLGVFNLQPSEITKLVLIIALAAYFSRNEQPNGYSLRELWAPGLLLGTPVLLIMKQPDLGTAMMLMFIGVTMALFSGIRRSALMVLSVSGILAMVGGWFLLHGYQKDRIRTFLNPERDPLGTGYHIIQSKIAVGSGGFWGKGFMQGTQSQLSFLPERHTDFAFSVFAEEWGLIGSLLLLALYLMIVLWGIMIARKAGSSFGMYLGIGVTAMIFWHIIVNLGMVIGLLPVVGVPLPLFSYGGTSMVTTMIGTGLLLNISMRRFMF